MLPSKKKKIPEKQKIRLFEKQGGNCFYCSRKTKYTDLTFDHIIPRLLGGITRPYNLVLACWDCNTVKGHKTFGEFWEFIDLRLRKYLHIRNIKNGDDISHLSYYERFRIIYYRNILKKLEQLMKESKPCEAAYRDKGCKNPEIYVNVW